MRTVAIAQARMGSTRLPGKVMMDLCGDPVISWVYDALVRAPGIDQVVIATSTLAQDDTIASWCDFNGVACYRGSETDVLDRFVGAAKKFNADYILRATCDCPFIDPNVVGQVVRLMKSEEASYCSNVNPPTFPDGLDIEMFTRAALMLAHEEAINPSDRDTVTQFIVRNRSRFPAANLTCPIPGMHKERWVLDTAEDMALCRQIALFFSERHKFGPPSYLDILKVLDDNPHLRKINEHLGRNERFYEGLANEKREEYDFSRSQKALRRALRTIPLGAQTFSKSYVQFPGTAPLFLSHGDGCYAFDIDGNRFVDLVCGLLPNVLGYCDSDVDYAVRRQLNSGVSFSLATELEAELSEKLVRLIPCAEMTRFGKNGSDVTAAAIRLARGFTGRNKVMMIENGYHGWHDWSIATTPRNLGVPTVMQTLAKRVSSDLNQVERSINKTKSKPVHEQYAAIIVEPEGRTNAWLRNLKGICDHNGIVLIFDEIITGFRWSLGGYQKYIGVTPDLACFGKAMANGWPLSAVVGLKPIMMKMQPPDNIFYSGTFAGEAVSIAASIATINKIEKENVCAMLWQRGEHLKKSLTAKLVDAGLSESMFIHGDAPRTHVKFLDTGGLTGPELQLVWMDAMIKAGVLIINANNISYSLHDPAFLSVLKAYDKAFDIMLETVKKGKALWPSVEYASVR